MMHESTNGNSGEAPVHDQLSSIEAIRIHAAAQLRAVDRAIAASPRNSPGVQSIKPRSTSPQSADEEEQVHDQLPTVEEIRAHALVPSSSPLRVRWGVVGCLMILTIVLGTGIGLGVGLANKNGSSSSASAGNSANFPNRSSKVNLWLVSAGLSTNDDLSDADSPQYKAAEWISNGDPLRLPIPEGKESRTAFVERYALAVFFFATSGDEWLFNLGFVSGKPTCAWNRVFVFPGSVPGETRTLNVGAVCNTAAEVTSLSLPGNRLAGIIPEEISHLTMLNYMGLETNDLIGELPDSMSKLTLLEYLALQYNEIAGEVPSNVGELTNLRVLGLGNNVLLGTVPTTISRLTNLLTLGFDDNLLSGDLSFLQGLTSLERLYLEDNRFVHSLDSNVFSGMTNLEELDLSTNGINGNIPSPFFEFDNLTILDLHDNQLTGSIPPEIPVNQKLTFISVAGNSLTGSIPSTIANCSNATHLDFSQNAFTGTFPEELATMKKLVYLFLASNAFESAFIPSWMSQLTGLKDLSLRNTSRLGPIPEFLGTMTNLILLDLSFNDLEFTIPSSLGQLKELVFLFLNRNDLKGVVPQEIQELGSIEVLLIDKNGLKGSVELLCNNTIKIPRVLIADCDSLSPEVICPCCTLCCDDSRLSCNDNVYYGSLDPIWENSYEREFYEFAPGLIFGDNYTR